MTYLLGSFLAVMCVFAGEWLLRTGVQFQLNGLRKGISLQVIGGLVMIGLPLLVALLIN